MTIKVPRELLERRVLFLPNSSLGRCLQVVVPGNPEGPGELGFCTARFSSSCLESWLHTRRLANLVERGSQTCERAGNNINMEGLSTPSNGGRVIIVARSKQLNDHKISAIKTRATS